MSTTLWKNDPKLVSNDFTMLFCGPVGASMKDYLIIQGQGHQTHFVKGQMENMALWVPQPSLQLLSFPDTAWKQPETINKQVGVAVFPFFFFFLWLCFNKLYLPR